MLTNTLILLFERDLNKLISELNLYQNEVNIWKIENNISNSAGNLALHLIGNLNSYTGKKIGKTEYIRNRELEFSLKNIPRKELIHEIEKTILVVKTSLEMIKEVELKNEFPILVFSKKTTTEYFLVHLTTHLAYHLGQINYHRRLIENY